MLEGNAGEVKRRRPGRSRVASGLACGPRGPRGSFGLHGGLGASTLGGVFSRRIRVGLGLLMLFQFGLCFTLAWARFQNVHQRTFDLALYARVAWGFAHGDAWSSVLNTHALGAHVSPVLLPLGLLGRLASALGARDGQVWVLLCAQAACVALALWPFARIAARRAGLRGIWLAAAAWLLYPNLGHVTTYEFHPGTLAVLPMAWAYDALDRGKLGALGWACLGVLACREDLGAFCVLIALLAYRAHADQRTLGLALACLLYSALATAAVVWHAPENGSLAQHFGVWGGSPLGVFKVIFTDPARAFEHFSARERLSYLPRVLAPLSLFSLRAPHLLVPALPYLALNLISTFPTATEQYSHYLTPAVPAIVAAGLVGVVQVQARFVRVLWFFTLGIGFHAMGGLPLARDFDRAAFRADANTEAARRVLAHIPAMASVQAPDPLLPHLAERPRVHRAPPPERGTEYVVLDVSHRERFAKRDDLLRTQEEPLVRSWLAREDYGLVVYAPPYALLARGKSTRESAAVQSFFRPPAGPPFAPIALTACLSVEYAARAADRIVFGFVAHGACPADLALYLGPTETPARADLLFEGALSPAQLRAGDRLRSEHVLSLREQKMYTDVVHISLLRQSGAQPTPSDPRAVRLALR